MAEAGVRVKGLREVVRSLERYGTEVSDLKAAFRRIGGLVADEAEPRAPRLSGRLAGSIRPSNSKNKAVVRAGGAAVPYAGVQHYGGYHGIEAKPFLTDALAAKQSDAIAALESELGDLIRSLDLR